MFLPGETEAGSAGMQPCRGIAWWAHRDDDWERETNPLALLPTIIGSKDPDALNIPARRAEYSLTENAHSPFHAEPEQRIKDANGSIAMRALPMNDFLGIIRPIAEKRLNFQREEG